MELFFIQSAAYPDVFQVILHKSMLFGKNISDERYKRALKNAHKQLLLHNPLKNAHPSPSIYRPTHAPLLGVGSIKNIQSCILLGTQETTITILCTCTVLSLGLLSFGPHTLYVHVHVPCQVD